MAGRIWTGLGAEAWFGWCYWQARAVHTGAAELFAPVMVRSTKLPGAMAREPVATQLLFAVAVQERPASCMAPGVPERRLTVMPLALLWVEKTARLVAVQPLGTQVRTEAVSVLALVALLTEKKV